ncbi:MAG: hypothetical protein Fur0028_05730 [Bacteroidales bacterium]
MFKMKYLGILILLLMVVISCNTNHSVKINNKKEITLNGLENSYFESIQNFIYNGKNAIGYLIKNDSTVLLVLSNEEGNILNQIKIDFNIFKEQYYADIFSFLNCIKNDSIIFVSGEKEICIYNNNKVQKVDLNFKTEQDYNLLSSKSFSLTRINDSILLAHIIRKINQSTPEGRAEYFKYPPLIFINIKEENAENVKNINIYFPYFVKLDSGYYIDQQMEYAVENNNIYYLMKRSPLIYKKNLKIGILDSSIIESNYIKLEEIIPFDDKYLFSKDYYSNVIEYSYEIPKFSYLFFNKDLSILYRVNSISTPYEKNGKRTNYRNWSVSVIDTNLNLIGEIPFLNDSLYNFFNFIPSSKGFIVGYKQTNEDKRLKRTRLCEFEISF